MYKVTIPTSLTAVLNFGEEATLSELKRAAADRLFIHIPRMLEENAERRQCLSALSEKIRFFEKNGIETVIWISPLLGFSGSSEEGCEGFTRVKKLHDGKEYKGVFCPMDDGFSEASAAFVKALAQTGAKLIMLDDEFCLSGRGDGGIGCCCEAHLQAYAARIGEMLSREQICEKAFCGSGNTYRNAWMELQGETLLTFAEKLRKAVDSVNPQIRMGFCAGRTSWDVEGVDAIRLSRAFAGKTKPILRLAGAPYWTRKSPDWTGGLQGIIEATRLQAHWCADAGIEIFSEGDVNPRPRFAVPAAFLEGFDMAMRADGNTDGCMKYMLDYFGSPKYETGYIDRHIRNRMTFDGIEEMFAGKDAVGVNIFENMFLLRDRKFPDTPGEFEEGEFPADNDKFRIMPTASQVFACENSLPITYGDFSAPTIVFGENAHYIPENVPYLILDGCAAKILINRGWDIGAEGFTKEHGVWCETDEKDGERERTPSMQCVYRAKLKPGAEVESMYEGENTRFPAMYRYENKKGQRFLVYTFDAYTCRTLGKAGESGGMFAGYSRQKRLLGGLAWMSGSHIAVSCAGNPWLYMLCKKKDGVMAVGLWNFFEDEIFSPTVRLDRAYEEVRFLNCDGILERDTVKLSDSIAPYGFVAFEVR